jgi:hypothetical protein
VTLIAAWIRKNSNLKELVLASDSRVSGGESWDTCPKLVALPRPATAIAMSGDATAAYAFLLHAINTCTLLDGHQSGRSDIGYLANKLRVLYAASRREVSDLPLGQSAPDVVTLNVVLVGWSWRNLCFEGYSYRYDKNGHLQMRRLPSLAENSWGSFYFAGDASRTAQARTWVRIRNNGYPLMHDSEDPEKLANETFLNWEPLETLLDVIADPSARTVGGAPQLMKIYQYGECESFVWRDANGSFYGGREIDEKERFDRRIASFSNGDLTTEMPPRP